MDWPPGRMPTDLWVLPRGVKRDGLTSKNPLTWTSKYGSLVAASTEPSVGQGTSDGMNEKGLGVNLLWLGSSDYGARDAERPGLSISLWAQYFLDNFATVEEAVRDLEKATYQVVTAAIELGGAKHTAGFHLSLEDKTGDSAIIEYVGGKVVVHHGRRYAIMTNDPDLDKQLDNLKQYEGLGGDKPLPGSINPDDRFVRASYYVKNLPKPNDLREAIAGVLSVTRNVSQPFSTTKDPKHPNSSATLWRVVADLTHDTYYFELTTSPYLVWVRLDAFNLKPGSSPMKLDMCGNADRYGDVTRQFVKAAPFKFASSEKPQ
jgi:penicillin V acylase-like amidase (Ntn superfamily)